MSRKAVEGYETVLGKKHFQTLRNVSYLASLLRVQGKYVAAEKMDRKAVE